MSCHPVRKGRALGSSARRGKTGIQVPSCGFILKAHLTICLLVQKEGNFIWPPDTLWGTGAKKSIGYYRGVRRAGRFQKKRVGSRRSRKARQAKDTPKEKKWGLPTPQDFPPPKEARLSGKITLGGSPRNARLGQIASHAGDGAASWRRRLPHLMA